jgi:hypothetical protein
VLFSDRLAAPLAWEPEAAAPLVVLGIARRRSLFARLFGWLRPGSV